MGVSIRQKNEDGIWWLFIRHRGERVSQQVGSDRDVAEDAKKDIERDIRRGKFDIAAMKAARAPEKPQKPPCPTVAEHYDKTFKPIFVDTAVARSTAAKYDQNFRIHIIPGIGSLKIDEVGREEMEEFIAALVKKVPQSTKKKTEEADSDQKDSKTDEDKPTTLSKDTIETIVSNLRAFFNHARSRKLVHDNPATGLSRFYSQARTKTEIVQALTREDVPLFLKSVAKHASKHYALFFTAIHTGLRAGELAGLEIGDIDFHGKYLLVQRSIDRAHRKVVPTKTKRIRRIDLSDELIPVLKEHIRKSKEDWLKKKIPEGETRKPQPTWLFPNDDGGWIDMANVSERHFHPSLSKAGLHHRRFHDLRHTFASLLLTNGAPIQYVSEQMGHATIQLTVKLYGHLQPGANRHWMNSLPGLTTPSPTQTIAAAAD